MNQLIKDYKLFKENDINLTFEKKLEELKKNRDNSLSKLYLLDTSLDYKSEEKFIYDSALGFKFIQNNPQYSKLFLKGFLESNLDLIKFGDLSIFDHNIKKRINFKKDNLFSIFDSLLEDNKPYTIILKEDSAYFKEFYIKEVNLSFKAFFDD